jgi:hypothetical protein
MNSSTLQDFKKNVPVMLLWTRFTNAIDCFEPGPREPYWDIFLKCLYVEKEEKHLKREM